MSRARGEKEMTFNERQIQRLIIQVQNQLKEQGYDPCDKWDIIEEITNVIYGDRL